MAKNIVETLELPSGISAQVDGSLVTVKGPKGEVQKHLRNVLVQVSVDGNNLAVSAPNDKKRSRKIQRSFLAHLKNMVKGVEEGYVYTLKICSGHFPMNVTASGNEFVVKNFIGEKTPRKLALRDGVTVKVNGDDITVESVDKELAGQTAASIEQLTKRSGFDTRIFQAGIFITSKAGKELKA